SANTDISQCPCSTRCRSCANYNGDNNENSQHPNDAATDFRIWNPSVEVGQVGLCHVVVRQHSGKGEEHNCESHEAWTETRAVSIDTVLHESRSHRSVSRRRLTFVADSTILTFALELAVHISRDDDECSRGPHE